MRDDIQRFDVTSLVTASNSGTAAKALPSPKASLTFGPWFRTEFYAQAGFSFHSNDGRGTMLNVEPVSADNPYSGTPATPVPALIPTKGGGFGVRTAAAPHLQSTFSVWYLHSASELQQSGDTGGTVASQEPSERYGFEWANFYTPGEHLAIDLDLANSKASSPRETRRMRHRAALAESAYLRLSVGLWRPVAFPGPEQRCWSTRRRGTRIGEE